MSRCNAELVTSLDIVSQRLHNQHLVGAPFYTAEETVRCWDLSRHRTTVIQMTGDRLVSEFLNGKTYWFAQSERNGTQHHPGVHLLPNYDEYLIAHKDHTEVLDPSLLPDRASVEAALGGHILVVHGRVMGGWRRTVDKDEVVVEAKPLARLDASEADALNGAAQRYGLFLGMPASVLLSPPPA